MENSKLVLVLRIWTDAYDRYSKPLVDIIKATVVISKFYSLYSLAY